MPTCWFCKQTIEMQTSSLTISLRKYISRTYTGLPHIGVDRISYQVRTLRVPCCNKCKTSFKSQSAYNLLGGLFLLGSVISVEIFFNKILPFDLDWLRIALSIIVGIIVVVACIILFVIIIDRVDPSSKFMGQVTLYDYPDLKEALDSGWEIIRKE